MSMKMTMAEFVGLEPCPFCGGEAETIRNDIGVFIGCFNADCPIGPATSTYVDGYDTEAEAIAAWNSRADYHGYEQAAIEAWESIKAWNSRAERTCECIACAYFENKSTCGAYCNYFDRELGDDYDGGCTWGVLSGCKVVGE